MQKFFTLIVLFALTTVLNANLEVIRDDELTDLIKSEKYLVVLFCRRRNEDCIKYENQLIDLREDLVETLNAWVVKVIDSQLTRLYSPSKEPILVFFRDGIPLLYDGPLNDELILHTFTNNIEPIVKELTDETFEHLTQAATGATTGDWFIMFYTLDCVDCLRLQAQWETVGAQLKSRMNVARVNRGTTGAATARRFDVFHVPAFILFRQGKMYRYQIPKYDIASFVSFAQDWYKNMKPERVPVPKSPFDDLIAAIVDYLRLNEWLWKIGLGTFLIGILFAVYVKYCKKPKSGKPKSKKGTKEK